MSAAEPSHAERAEAHLINAQEAGFDRPLSQAWIAAAQAEATLAVAAEQKRIADWLDAWPISNRGFPIMEHWGSND